MGRHALSMELSVNGSKVAERVVAEADGWDPLKGLAMNSERDAQGWSILLAPPIPTVGQKLSYLRV